MKNFRLAVKMMVMALAMGALFCSCSVAGGFDYYETSESQASSTSINGGLSENTSQSGKIGIVISSVSVSVSGPDEVAQSETETATFTAEATEGATLTWYVNGKLQSGETGSTFELSCAEARVYDVTCMALSADGKVIKSDSKMVVVNP